MENVSTYLVLLLSGIILGGIGIVLVLGSPFRTTYQDSYYRPPREHHYSNHHTGSTVLLLIVLFILLGMAALVLKDKWQDIGQPLFELEKKEQLAAMGNYLSPPPPPATEEETVLIDKDKNDTHQLFDAPSKETTESLHDTYLQVGAYDDYSNARQHANALFQQGHPVIISEDVQQVHHVLVGPFEDREAARNYNRRYRLEGFVVGGISNAVLHILSATLTPTPHHNLPL